MVKPNLRYHSFVVMLVVIVSIIAGQAVNARGVTNSEQKPVLRPASLRPLTLQGLHFRAGESVRVTVGFDGTTRSANRRANALGAFTATFPVVRVDRCSGELVVKASGGRGSRAGFRLNQLLCNNDRADD
jgi:hypothetical protein